MFFATTSTENTLSYSLNEMNRYEKTVKDSCRYGKNQEKFNQTNELPYNHESILFDTPNTNERNSEYRSCACIRLKNQKYLLRSFNSTNQYTKYYNIDCLPLRSVAVRHRGHGLVVTRIATFVASSHLA